MTVNTITRILDFPEHLIDEVLYLKDNQHKGEYPFLGNGMYSNVFALNEQFAVKLYIKSAAHHMRNDGMILSDLQGHSCFPKVYAYHPDFVIMERICGCTLSDFPFSDLGITPVENWLERIRDSFDYSWSKEWYPSDVTKRNVMFRMDGTPVIVDVGSFFELIGEPTEDIPTDFDRMAFELNK